jgi:hypothetical protein
VRLQAQQAAGQQVAAGAHHAGQAQNLPGPQLEADVRQAAGPLEAPHLQQHRPPACAQRREIILDLAAHHQADEPVLGQLPGGMRAHHPAVLEHRDPIGDLEDLLQHVGNVDDRDPALLRADDAEQPAQFLVGEARRKARP